MQLSDSVIEALWFADEDPARSHEEASRSMAASLATALGLKPFPRAAGMAAALLADPDYNVGELERVLAADPALVGRVIRVANSSGAGRPVESLHGAVVLLGARALGAAVTAAAVLGMFQDARGVGAGVLEHSIGVSTILRVIEQHGGYRGEVSLGLVGLLHDVGKLLLIQAREFSYPAEPGADTDHLAERTALGFDHGVLGAHAVRAWQVSDQVAQIIAWHHQDARALEQGGDLAVSLSLLRVADRLEHELAISRRVDRARAESLCAEPSFAYLRYEVSDVARIVHNLGPHRTVGSRAPRRAYGWKL
ncbi:MAG: HDOD domain-containing protein [Deltaproteobacteria bacterium]|nr:HDOD domain-containing protein [Deltaproteobacteria bacterium]